MSIDSVSDLWDTLLGAQPDPPGLLVLVTAVIALAVLLSRYRFDSVAETKPWPVQKLTTQPQGGLPMRVTRR